MKITKREVRTISHIEITTADLADVIKRYLNSEADKIVYPKAFSYIKIDYDMNELQLVTALRGLFNEHGETFTVIARHLGFDGYENAGFYKASTGRYSMVVYTYGDALNN